MGQEEKGQAGMMQAPTHTSTRGAIQGHQESKSKRPGTEGRARGACLLVVAPTRTICASIRMKKSVLWQ